MCGGRAPKENLKINDLGPYSNKYRIPHSWASSTAVVQTFMTRTIANWANNGLLSFET